MIWDLILYHVTPLKNAGSINRWGLDPFFAKNPKQAIWLTASVRDAIPHVSARHKCPVDNLLVYPVYVKREWLTAHWLAGWNRTSYYTRRVLSVDRLGPAILALSALGLTPEGEVPLY